jgi:hypothetical protein
MTSAGKIRAALPPGVKQIFARADAGCYRWEAIEAYLQADCRFVVVAHRTARLIEQLRQAEWRPSADPQAEAE